MNLMTGYSPFYFPLSFIINDNKTIDKLAEGDYLEYFKNLSINKINNYKSTEKLEGMSLQIFKSNPDSANKMLIIEGKRVFVILPVAHYIYEDTSYVPFTFLQ